MAESKRVKKHIVVFQDQDGQVLRTSLAGHGQAVEPPEVPAKIGESDHHEILFQGWDQNLSEVTSNLMTRPVYAEVPKQYLIMYASPKGGMLGTETVAYGMDARQPYHPEKEGSEEFEYVFSGWDKDLHAVDRDMMVHPVFEERRRQFRVRFYHEDGKLLKAENVPYGYGAEAPADPEKERDPTYYYTFSGWNKDYSVITGPVNVRATFEAHFRQYRLRFFERAPGQTEEKLIEEQQLHYGDPVIFPELVRKGYLLEWNSRPEKIEEDLDLHASWDFANPKGKRCQKDGSVYEVVNPSVTSGSVRLIQYQSKAREINLLGKVLLGDYWYRIEEIDETAFSSCTFMSTLKIPAEVKIIKKKAFSGCRALQTLQLGEGVRELGAEICSQCPRLKEIRITGNDLKKVSRDVCEKMVSPVLLVLPEQGRDRTRRFFERYLSMGKLYLK